MVLPEASAAVAGGTLFVVAPGGTGRQSLARDGADLFLVFRLMVAQTSERR